MHQDQTVFEMAQEVLERQASAMSARTGQTFEGAMQIVSDTEAGRQLRELRDGPWREGDRVAGESPLAPSGGAPLLVGGGLHGVA